MCDQEPKKVDYLSETVAQNAATLHEMACHPCPTIHAYRHGDHWHIGHRNAEAGARCKRDHPGGFSHADRRH